MAREYRSRDACPSCGCTQPGDDLCSECRRGQSRVCAVCERAIISGTHYRHVEDLGGDVHHACEVRVLRVRTTEMERQRDCAFWCVMQIVAHFQRDTDCSRCVLNDVDCQHYATVASKTCFGRISRWTTEKILDCRNVPGAEGNAPLRPHRRNLELIYSKQKEKAS